jgi:hypothetical protein
MNLNRILIYAILSSFIFNPFTNGDFFGYKDVFYKKAFSASTEINYQGKLMDSSGSAVSDGTYNLEFKLYTASTGGSPIWTETRTTSNRVQVTTGLFSVLLGSVASLSGVDFDQDLYLTVNVGGTDVTPSWDGEMNPRKKLASVPRAFVADLAKSLDATYATTTNLVVTNATTTNLFASGKVGIGKANPFRVFEVSGEGSASGMHLSSTAGLATMRIEDTLTTDNSGGAIEFNNYAGIKGLRNNTGDGSGSLAFFINNDLAGVALSEAMRIDSYGRLGIGTTTPGYPLTVSGDVNIAGALRIKGSSGTSGQVLLSQGSGSPIWVATSSLGISGGGGSGDSAFTVGNGLIYNSTSTDTVLIGGTSTTSANSALEIYNYGDEATGIKSSVEGDSGTTYGGHLTAISDSTGSNIYGLYVSASHIGDPGNVYAVYGTASGASSIGVYGTASGGGSSGVYGMANVSNGYAVRALQGNSTGYAIYSEGGKNYFQNNLGIGTTTPSAKLAITGTTGDGDILNIASSTNASLFRVGSTGAISFAGQAGTTGQVLLSQGSGSSPIWVATSSLGISGGGSLSGGTNGYVARWTSASTLSSGLFMDNGTVAGVNATSSSYTFNVQGSGALNPFNVASSSGSSLLSVSLDGKLKINNPNFADSGIEIYSDTDSNNPSNRALYITGPANGSRLFFGTSSKTLHSLNFSNVSTIEGMPGFYTIDNMAWGIDTASHNIGRVSHDVIYNSSGPSAGDHIWYGSSTSWTGYASSNERMRLTGDGFLGIATTTPGYTLTVAGDISLTGAIRASGNAGTSGMVLQTTGTGVQWVATSSLGISGGGGSGTVNSGTAGQIAFYSSTGDAVSGTSTVFLIGNNVGIGTTTADYRLTVDGDLSISGAIRVGGDNDPGTSGMVLMSGGSGSPTWVATSSLGISGGGSSKWTQAGDDIYFLTGKVGVGKSNPTERLDVSGNIKLSGDFTAGSAYWAQAGNSLSVGAAGGSVDVTRLSSTSIAFMDSTQDQLRRYDWDGTDWVQVGNGLNIASVTTLALTALNSTDVAFIDISNDQLRTYRFDGTDWSQVGNSLSIAGVATGVALAALNSTDVAFIDGTNDSLRTYRFNGTDWAQVGNSFAVGAVGAPALAKLTETDVAFTDVTSDTLRVYRFDGTDWVEVGNRFSVAGIVASASLAAFNSTDVALIDSGTDILQMYRFNGTDWSKFGDPLTIDNAGALGIVYLANNQIAFSDITNDELRTYEFIETISFVSSNKTVGIGVTSPNATLDIRGLDGINMLNIASSSGSIAFNINQAGRVGVGTSTQDQALVVVGGIRSTALLGGSTNLTVDASGNIIRDPSDESLKENIQTIEDALEKVEKLRGVSYEWLDKARFGSSTEIGVIAQEVEEVVPEVVSSGGDYKSVNIKNLVALLIEAIKEISTKIKLILEWFSSDMKEFTVGEENTLKIEGELCLDDMCFTKEQLKNVLSGGQYQQPVSEPVGSVDDEGGVDSGTDVSVEDKSEVVVENENESGDEVEVIVEDHNEDEIEAVDIESNDITESPESAVGTENTEGEQLPVETSGDSGDIEI